MKRNLKLISFSLLFCSLSAVAVTPVDRATQLILSSTHNQVTIEHSFPSIANLRGFVVQPKDPAGKKAIIYADKNGNYLLIGALINANGISLTHQDYLKYIPTPLAENALKMAQSENWFEEGNINAKRTAYILAEPNCFYTNSLYKKLSSHLKAGDLDVRWILVDFIKPSSVNKAAAILQAKNPVQAFDENEKNYNIAKQEGGISPAKEIDSATKKKLKANNQFMEDQGLPGTPVIIYRDLKGKAHIWIETPNEDGIKHLLSDMGYSF